MTIMYLLEVHSHNDDHAALPVSACDRLVGKLKSLPGLSGLYMFTQAGGGHDPFLKDEHPPLLVMQLQFNDHFSLQTALLSPEFDGVRTELAALPVKAPRLLQEAMLLEAFLSAETAEGSASLSYLVNYQRPAEDELRFLQYYRAHHPAILMNFPAIRRVELGLPLDWTPVPGIEHADRMLYCEVSFDNIEALNSALDSDVRRELRRDYECFPPFSGVVTHFPMHRLAMH